MLTWPPTIFTPGTYSRDSFRETELSDWSSSEPISETLVGASTTFRARLLAETTMAGILIGVDDSWTDSRRVSFAVTRTSFAICGAKPSMETETV